jgi:hypothetical protein
MIILDTPPVGLVSDAGTNIQTLLYIVGKTSQKMITVK